MEKCNLCNKPDEESGKLTACDRCKQEVCDNCLTDGYPYLVDLCIKCMDKWREIMDNNNFIY